MSYQFTQNRWQDHRQQQAGAMFKALDTAGAAAAAIQMGKEGVAPPPAQPGGLGSSVANFLSGAGSVIDRLRQRNEKRYAGDVFSNPQLAYTTDMGSDWFSKYNANWKPSADAWSGSSFSSGPDIVDTYNSLSYSLPKSYGFSADTSNFWNP